MRIHISHLLTNEKALFLACDQGMEHGPADFNAKNIDTEYIMNIALEGDYNGLILHQGLAEKYCHGPYKEIPIIVKLNGKTRLTHNEPFSPTLCSVERALKLNTAAVGYTLYPGSIYENMMYEEFGRIVEKAHDYGLPVIAWMYPRGRNIPDPRDTNLLAYCARLGLELGADILKIHYNDDLEGFKWVVKCAGRAKVVVAGGVKQSEREFLNEAKEAMQTGAIGYAIGRNIWQHERPFSITKALRSIIFKGKSVDESLEYLE